MLMAQKRVGSIADMSQRLAGQDIMKSLLPPAPSPPDEYCENGSAGSMQWDT